MLSIRLVRTGKTHAPHYRIAVQERRSRLQGKCVEVIGHYHPADKAKTIVLVADRARYWLGQGAQPSETVTNILVKEGVFSKDKKISLHFESKKAPVVATPAPAETEEVTPVVEEEEEVVVVEEAVEAEAAPVEEVVEAEESSPEAK